MRVLTAAVAVFLVALALPTSDIGFTAVEMFESAAAAAGLVLLLLRRTGWAGFVAAALMYGNTVEGVWDLIDGTLPWDLFSVVLILVTVGAGTASAALWLGADA